jgi:Fungal fucose-specific lectin
MTIIKATFLSALGFLCIFASAAHGQEGPEFGDRTYYVTASQHLLQGFVTCDIPNGGSFCIASTITYGVNDLTTLFPTFLPEPTSAISIFNFSSSANAEIDTVFEGTDQHFHDVIEYNNDNGQYWEEEDLTTMAAAPPAAVASAIANLSGSNGNYHLYYFGTDNHVHEIYSNSHAVWDQVDVSLAAGAPSAVAGSALVSWIGGSFELVYFLTPQGHIGEVASQDKGVTWAYKDITTTAGAPVVAAGSQLAGYENGSSSQVYFFTADGHVHSVRTSGALWLTTDLTSAANAPVAANVHSLAAVPLGNTFVYYETAAGHIDELTSSGSGSSGVWSLIDISLASSATAAEANTPIIATNGRVAQYEVYYIGSDQVERLLYNTGSGWLSLNTQLTPATATSKLAFGLDFGQCPTVDFGCE